MLLKLLNKFPKTQRIASYSSFLKYTPAKADSHPLPSRPAALSEAQFPRSIESRDEFKFVERILPDPIVPEPPKHASYPTPSGWVPPDHQKASRLSYFVMRTRFHNFPIYPMEREGGTRKLVKIKNVEGDIWQFDKDLRAFIKECVANKENKTMNVYSQVNELQRQVVVKGHFQEFISEFFKQCGF